MKIIFIADFFIDQVLGGGELNNEELIEMLIKDGHKVKKLIAIWLLPTLLRRIGIVNLLLPILLICDQAVSRLCIINNM